MANEQPLAIEFGVGVMTVGNQVAEASGKYLVEAAGQAVPVGYLCPPGYKQTEVGVIPEDWIAKELGELVTISSGESPSKFQFLSEGLPYFKVEQLNNGSVYAEETPYFINSPKNVPAGSVIFPKRGASILSNKIRILKSDSFMDTNLMALTCSKSLSELYLYNQLSYRGLDSVADTTSIPQINNKHIVPYRIPYPKLEEQTAIANALSDVDALIQSLEKLIAKKQAIKTATLQQLLTGRTRLPPFALREDGTQKGYKQSELGEIPEDWDAKSLGELCNLKSGSGITAKNIDDLGIYPCFGGNGLRGFTKNFTHDGNYALIGRQGALCGNVQYVTGKIFVSEHALVATPLNAVHPKWLAIYLERMNLNQYSESSAQPGLSAEKLRILKLIVPTESEQTAIAAILSDMDADIQTLQQRLSKTRQIKQGMIQELLTGKIRLIKPEPSISANVSKEYAHE